MKKYPAKYNVLVVPVSINTVLLLLLAVLHFYWTFGGRLWYEDVLPTNTKGTNRFNPGTASTLIVAFGLLLFALITAGSGGLYDNYFKRKYFRYGTLAIALIFLLRAIGDFKFIGFFKTVNKTRFGINDTLFFSPLCLFISVTGLFAFIFSRERR